ncbi:MAG: DUF11 domain-containing protein [Parvularculaceae bacterium]
MLSTPPAVFTIEARRTPSTIEFFRVSPNAPDAVAATLNGSDYWDGTAFVPVGAPTLPSGAAISAASPTNIARAGAYFSGEMIIVRVSDAGQNGDPSVIETVVATVQTAGGDFVRLRLYESGPDTGEFFAYLSSTAGSVNRNDPILTVLKNQTLTARYQDPFDANEVSLDTAVVDPYGRLFDSLTGVLLDGAQITIVDDATGLPARVFGADGVSIFPSTITTGQPVADASGLVYYLGPGEFQFPIMFPGRYRLEIIPPAGYSAPSAEPASAFASLPNAPFTIIAASYGGAFDLPATGNISFDVPLDPQTDIVVQKAADSDNAAIGDFIRYRISVENNGAAPTPLTLSDRLPAGFRYQPGSARVDGARVPDPSIDSDGVTLRFSLGAIQPVQTMELAYVTEVGPGARGGEAINTVIAIAPSGRALSNRAQAATFVRDDFLRRNFTIVGRVVEDACDITDEQVTQRRAGKGVAGVRLYMETGATVVSDENGRFHFEDITPGAHVVQLDEASLNDAYDVVQCVDNTRFAGRGFSQFVDARGGALWRADFYLRRKADKRVVTAPARASAQQEAFDQAWLNRQTAEFDFVYPDVAATPSSASINIAFKHDANLRASLFVNGRKASEANFAGRDVNSAQTVAISRWRGMDLLKGENRFEAVLYDGAEREVARLARDVAFIDEVTRAGFAPAQSVLIADGETNPVIAVKMTDAAGRPVHGGRLVEITVAPPYRSADKQRQLEAAPLDDPLTTRTTVSVGEGGVARIELEPTVETGIAEISVTLDDGRRENLRAYLKPSLREWIVVGLAEASGGLEKTEDVSGVTPNDLIGDGRIAGFAKGAVKGGWLVTLAGDSKQKRGDQDTELFDAINPDDRYAIVGDRSTQEFEAQSRYPVYAKAEKGAFQAMFGDYDTRLTESKLGRYSRRLSGLQSSYEGDIVSFTGFAAETNQAFVKDEIPADGTSGPFMLSVTPLVRNSETVIIETRDRFRPDIVISRTPLVRYADYDIDFRTGEILLRLPTPSADAAFNPNVLVVDYETSAPLERALTVGGRGAVRLIGGKARLGATVIHEETPGPTAQTAQLVGADFNVDFTDADRLRLEYAATLRGQAAGADAHAILAELVHKSERLSASAYYSRTEVGFGLSQQNSATAGIVRYGADASLKIAEFENAAGTARGARFVDAKAYREENLQTGASRTVAEATLRQDANTTSASVGLRRVEEKPQSGARRRGAFVIAKAQQNFEGIGLTVRASRDQPIAGDDASSLFPTRTSVGFDQQLFEHVTLSATHEVLGGDAISQSNTIVGVTAEPWSGAKLTAAADRLTQDSAERIGATFGVDQQVRFSEKWSGSLGVSRREDLKSNGAPDIADDIVADAPRSPFEQTGGAFTSLYTGAGYRSAATTGSARIELKKSALGQRYTFVAGAAREVSEEFSFAAAGRYQQENNDAAPDQRNFDARIGAAWRPNSDGVIIFNRLDLKQNEMDLSSRSWKAVHNLAVNAVVDDRLQVSFNHGLKYASFTADDASYDAITQLAGVEARFDLTPRIDISLHGEALYSYNSKTLEYAYGPAIGFTPADNVWLSFGWNFDGFDDDDFVGAEYSRAGPYLKVRIKFDQLTARGLLSAISPDSSR